MKANIQGIFLNSGTCCGFEFSVSGKQYAVYWIKCKTSFLQRSPMKNDTRSSTNVDLMSNTLTT